MEILMKLKCSPASSGSPALPTLKVVDHHRQLQQQHTLLRPVSVHSPAPATLSQTGLSPAPIVPQEVLIPVCPEYATPAMDCCTAAAQQDILLDLQWRGQRQSLGSSSNNSHRHLNHGVTGEYVGICDRVYFGASYEPPPCCTGVSYAMTTPPPPPPTEPLPLTTAEECTAQYEYHEPEENFVSIDDAKIKGLLLKIGREREALKEEQRRVIVERDAAKAEAKAARALKTNPVFFEIIDLDVEEEREKLQRIKREVENKLVTQQQVSHSYARKTKSPSISLIPKIPESELLSKAENIASKKEKIIAQIELLDSSSESETGEGEEEEDGDDDELPLAAAAVSCELECTEDDDDDVIVGSVSKKSRNNGNFVILASDDENVDFIDENEEGPELRWDDLESQRERSFFECFLCGKTVQSSYNLRRHMMIHTGERPFGCDLCDRRFREFSDLKKHRRRHVNESNFVCMVCRVNPPTDHDPTRCSSCDSKSGIIITGIRPQESMSPGKCQTPPNTSIKKPPSRSLTPATRLSPSSSPVSCISNAQISPPPLTPISSVSAPSTAATTITADAQLLLDNIPAVHRPSYNQPGVITRKEFPCPLCQRPFGTRHNLKRHFMIHTGEKPFSCSNCRKPFREYSTLKKHMITHQRDRWYKCLRCPKKYRDYLDYMKHRDTHPNEELIHIGTSSDSKTPSPKKRSTTKSNYDDCYDSNDEDSSGEDCIECCECKQRFTELETYTEHLKQHDPSLFLYECYVCKSNFGTHAKLVQHMQHIHNGEQSEEEMDVAGQETNAKRKRLNSAAKK